MCPMPTVTNISEHKAISTLPAVFDACLSEILVQSIIILVASLWWYLLVFALLTYLFLSLRDAKFVEFQQHCMIALTHILYTQS